MCPHPYRASPPTPLCWWVSSSLGGGGWGGGFGLTQAGDWVHCLDGRPRALHQALTVPQATIAAVPQMYCTGGIRCDIYSTALKAKGFKNLYTLHGGIQVWRCSTCFHLFAVPSRVCQQLRKLGWSLHDYAFAVAQPQGYFLEKGGDHWNGSLYVFDGRMAIGPEKEQYGGTAGGWVLSGADDIKQRHAPSSMLHTACVFVHIPHGCKRSIKHPQRTRKSARALTPNCNPNNPQARLPQTSSSSSQQQQHLQQVLPPMPPMPQPPCLAL